jgi:large subunit ribosomal protein L18
MRIRSKNEARKRRHMRVRKKANGTADKPRLNVFRSIKNIYAQLINDETGTTIAAASSIDKEIADQIKDKSNQDIARLVGQLIARRATEKGINEVVFDRGGYLYHGRIKALAEAAREEGLDF